MGPLATQQFHADSISLGVWGFRVLGILIEGKFAIWLEWMGRPRTESYVALDLKVDKPSKFQGPG